MATIRPERLPELMQHFANTNLATDDPLINEMAIANAGASR